MGVAYLGYLAHGFCLLASLVSSLLGAHLWLSKSGSIEDVFLYSFFLISESVSNERHI